MGYRLIDVELSKPLRPVCLSQDQNGLGIVARWHGRPIGFHMEERTAGARLEPEAWRETVDRYFAASLLAARVEEALPMPRLATRPSLTIAICTRNRADRLARLLRSLDPIVGTAAFPSIEVLIIDNGSTDHTRDVARTFETARHVVEARAGLNFARNRAVVEARGQLIAFLDDDVVVDRGWLQGLAVAWQSRPDAGGYSGLVLPYRLDTQAQIMFERRGGFRRGFRRIEFRSAHHHNPLFPVGAGSVGAGCNMAFHRDLLVQLGGFDEALDTGAPLPGGGDLDIFYRVLRSGRPIIYEPSYAVHHEHRETLRELKRQYWSWGLGFMAFLVKSRRTDPGLRDRHHAMIAWWFARQARSLLGSLKQADLQNARFDLAELWGGVTGLAGEYDRSRARIAAIRAALP
jgi:glycosyltransferase involved in cell wall biosynthesis